MLKRIESNKKQVEKLKKSRPQDSKPKLVTYPLSKVLEMATLKQAAIISTVLHDVVKAHPEVLTFKITDVNEIIQKFASPKQRETFETIVDQILMAKDDLIAKYGKVPETPSYP
jgi:hypothetical protein